MTYVSRLLLMFALVSVSGFADDLAGLTKRVENLEKLLPKRSSCSIHCMVYSSPNGTYNWSSTVIASGADASDAFQGAISKCDTWVAGLNVGGYTLQGVRYDQDGNANLRRNCVTASVE